MKKHCQRCTAPIAWWILWRDDNESVWKIALCDAHAIEHRTQSPEEQRAGARRVGEEYEEEKSEAREAPRL
jgi:hypothetical protein